ALAGVRVLVADDNRSTREVLERWLRSWGMEPKLVSGVPQALASLREEHFALAVIDAALDGLAPITGTPVVYLGAIELPETQARSRERGGQAGVPNRVMPDERRAAIPHARGGAGDGGSRVGRSIGEGREAAAPPAPPPQAVRRRLRILVAEDNDLNQ